MTMDNIDKKRSQDDINKRMESEKLEDFNIMGVVVATMLNPVMREFIKKEIPDFYQEKKQPHTSKKLVTFPALPSLVSPVSPVSTPLVKVGAGNRKNKSGKCHKRRTKFNKKKTKCKQRGTRRIKRKTKRKKNPSMKKYYTRNRKINRKSGERKERQSPNKIIRLNGGSDRPLIPLYDSLLDMETFRSTMFQCGVAICADTRDYQLGGLLQQGDLINEIYTYFGGGFHLWELNARMNRYRRRRDYLLCVRCREQRSDDPREGPYIRENITMDMSAVIDSVYSLLQKIDRVYEPVNRDRLHDGLLIFCWYLWTCEHGLYVPINKFLRTPNETCFRELTEPRFVIDGFSFIAKRATIGRSYRVINDTYLRDAGLLHHNRIWMEAALSDDYMDKCFIIDDGFQSTAESEQIAEDFAFQNNMRAATLFEIQGMISITPDYGIEVVPISTSSPEMIQFSRFPGEMERLIDHGGLFITSLRQGDGGQYVRFTRRDVLRGLQSCNITSILVYYVPREQIYRFCMHCVKEILSVSLRDTIDQEAERERKIRSVILYLTRNEQTYRHLFEQFKDSFRNNGILDDQFAQDITQVYRTSEDSIMHRVINWFSTLRICGPTELPNPPQ